MIYVYTQTVYIYIYIWVNGKPNSKSKRWMEIVKTVYSTYGHLGDDSLFFIIGFITLIWISSPKIVQPNMNNSWISNVANVASSIISELNEGL